MKARVACMVVILMICHCRILNSAPAITVSGNWSRSIGAVDLIGGAGTDLQSSYESAANQLLLAVGSTLSSTDSWRVDVGRSDSSWHGNFVLKARRTSTGSDDTAQPGTSTVSGGTSYQTIGCVSVELFSGSGNLNDLAIQTELSGMSVQVPVGSYSTTVIFTVIDI